jgi:hypothetical protein
MLIALPQSVKMGPQEKNKEEKDYYGGLQSGHCNHHAVKRGTERESVMLIGSGYAGPVLVYTIPRRAFHHPGGFPRRRHGRWG